MTLVSAGRPPHTIFRSFADPQKAETWARMLLSNGILPVTINGQALQPTGSQETTPSI
jgi:hypothetical protein